MEVLWVLLPDCLPEIDSDITGQTLAMSTAIELNASETATSVARVTPDSYHFVVSLTGELSERGLPLREFFESRLPNCKEMQASWRAQGVPQFVPSETVAWGLVGAAFDYRVRYFFAVTPTEHLVAAIGAGPDFRQAYGNLASSLTKFVA
jgi:hypothetical protein